MKRTLLAMASAAAVVLALAAPVLAASPSSGSVGPDDPTTSWDGASYTVGATASPAACDAAGDALCDHYSLSVAVSPDYWDTHTGAARIAISWTDSSDNFDLYVYSGGKLVASSTSGSSSSESVRISSPAGEYSLFVVPKLVTSSAYGGSVSFRSQVKPTASPSPPGGEGGGGHRGGNGGGGGGGTGGDRGGDHGGGPRGRTGTARGPGVGQRGFDPGFHTTGPVFNYRGPYYFEPPFRVARGAERESPKGALRLRSGAVANGHPASRGSAPASAPVGPAQRRAISVATTSDEPPSIINGFVWALIPLALLAFVLLWAVVVEPDEERPALQAGTRAADGRADRPGAGNVTGPPPGPIVMLGLATRRVLGWAARKLRAGDRSG